MKKNKKGIVIAGIAAILFLTGIFVVYRLNAISLYDDEHQKGNTSSNLLNGGLFCQVDDTIYFSNPYNQGTLYSMNTDLDDIKQIINDNVSYLNGAGKYIFYTKRNDKKKVDSDLIVDLSATGLYRLNKNTKSSTKLFDDPTQVACLYGNRVYYQHYNIKNGLQLYAAKIDDTDDKKILEEPCAPYAIDNDTIYYTGTQNDHAIHSIKTDGSQSTVLLDGNYYALTLQGDYLYFMDMSTDYSLKRISVSGGTMETLISKHLATYNVCEDNNTIYCQVDNGSENGLYEYKIDNQSLTKIVSGDFNYLHTTKDYLFFETYDQSSLYSMKLGTTDYKPLEIK